MRIKKTLLASLCFALVLFQINMLFAEPQALSFPAVPSEAAAESGLSGSGLLTSPIGVKQEHGVINLGSQGADKTAQLYLFHNTSDIPLWLKRVNYDQSKGVQAGWDVLLAGDSYSVLMLNRKPMDFACDLANTDLSAIVDCKDYVIVARIAKQKNSLASANIGDYWVTESWTQKSSGQEKLQEALKARNILVK